MSHDAVGADAAIAELISLAVRNRPDAALRLADRLTANVHAPHPAQIAACRGLACFIAADYDAAARYGEEALQASEPRDSPEVRVLAVAVRLLASAGARWAGADP
ncbi:MAG: hypothetical protein J0H64_07730, partial [Actinobacteria bacterium]|nr:hypothetical protein [Actinomycetota bacterium]